MAQTRMLTLHAPVRPDQTGQLLANFVKDGFKSESWLALSLAGTVYDARITALPDPNNPNLFASILLCTAYEGPAAEYHRFFWDKLTLFFVLVAFAAADSPFLAADLTPPQTEAFGVAEKVLLASDAPTDPDPVKEAALVQARTQAAAALPAAMAAVTAAMNQDDAAVAAGTLAVSKFTRFSNWVRKHDLTGGVGVPGDIVLDAPPNTTYPDKDLRVAPSGTIRNQFVAPDLLPPPWPPLT